MKIIPLLYIVALLFTSVVWGAVSDIVVGQRAGANQRFVQRVVTGTANPLKPLGFSSDGTFGAIAQIRGVTLGTPDGLSNIDITTNGAIRITANGTNSINTSTRKLFNSSGTEVFDWSSNTLLNNWNVTGSLKVGSEIVTGTPLASNAINTSVALNTKTVSANTVFTFSATPAVGQVFDLEVKNSSGAAVAITIPTSKDSSTGATVTSFTLVASPGRKVVSWRYDGTDYIITQGGSGVGGGEVFSSSTSAIDRLASFTDTTGKVIKDSGETAASLKARANHTGQQAWNTINGLPTTLAGYGITDGQPLNTNLNSISLLSDPNVDRLLFWDDSAGAWRHLTLGTNLSITDTTLNAVTGGSGSGSGFPLTGNADFGGYSASNINTITATSFVGDGSAITDLNAAELIGTIPSISTGLLTTQKARVVTPVAGVSNVIVTDNGDTTITLNDATETLTYSNTPPDGTRFEYTLTGQATATTVIIPETYSNALGSLRTSFTVPALKNANIVVKREAGRYVMWGDPIFITDYPANVSPTVDGILEVDQNGSTRSTLGQVKTLMSSSPTFTGIVTNSGAPANTANEIAGTVIDVTKELNTKTITTNTTFSFSAVPSTNQWFGLYVKNTGGSAVTVTFPSSKDSVTGSTVTTATAAATTGRQHLYWRYDGADYIIYRGSSGGGSGDAVLSGGNSWSGDQIISGAVSANSFTGSGAGLTLLTADELTGVIPDITTETLTTARAKVITPIAAVNNVINTDNGETVIVLDSTAETLSYSAVPPTGTRFEYSLIGHTADCVVTIPFTYSFNTGGLRNTFTVPANKLATIWVKREADRYVMSGDPTFLADLPNAAAPAISSLIEIDQGTAEGSQKATLANIKKTLRVGTKRTGTIASGGIGNATLDFESTDSYIYYVGGNATHTLPDAAANENCAIVYTFNGSYVITLFPDANDFIRYNAITLADATSITITGTVGQTAIILSDGTNWTTIGGNATYATAP